MTIPFEVSIKSLAPPHLSETITGVPEAKASLMAKPQVSPGPTDGKTNTSTFIRTEKLQIETYNGKTDTASVRWVNDCEFILQKLHPKNMKEQKAISMKILFTEKNSYTFEYAFVGSNNKQRGIVTKLE